jgi:hypothetical protein
MTKVWRTVTSLEAMVPSGQTLWANREEEVATTAFWGQIATYLTSMEYREGTAILYFNQLFNSARQHFLPILTSFESGQGKVVISSWSKGGTVLQRAGGGFNCNAT